MNETLREKLGSVTIGVREPIVVDFVDELAKIVTLIDARLQAACAEAGGRLDRQEDRQDGLEKRSMNVDEIAYYTGKHADRLDRLEGRLAKLEATFPCAAAVDLSSEPMGRDLKDVDEGVDAVEERPWRDAAIECANKIGVGLAAAYRIEFAIEEATDKVDQDAKWALNSLHQVTEERDAAIKEAVFKATQDLARVHCDELRENEKEHDALKAEVEQIKAELAEPPKPTFVKLTEEELGECYRPSWTDVIDAIDALQARKIAEASHD